jgi:hypothetical protein
MIAIGEIFYRTMACSTFIHLSVYYVYSVLYSTLNLSIPEIEREQCWRKKLEEKLKKRQSRVIPCKKAQESEGEKRSATTRQSRDLP